MDHRMALNRGCCFPNCTKLWWKGTTPPPDPRPKFHSRTLPSSVFRHSPVRMSQTLTVESALPETRMLPRRTMPDVRDWCPISVCKHVPVSTSHTLIDVSKLPLTTYVPSNCNGNTCDVTDDVFSQGRAKVWKFSCCVWIQSEECVSPEVFSGSRIFAYHDIFALFLGLTRKIRGQWKCSSIWYGRRPTLKPTFVIANKIATKSSTFFIQRFGLFVTHHQK